MKSRKEFIEDSFLRYLQSQLAGNEYFVGVNWYPGHSIDTKKDPAIIVAGTQGRNTDPGYAVYEGSLEIILSIQIDKPDPRNSMSVRMALIERTLLDIPAACAAINAEAEARGDGWAIDGYAGEEISGSERAGSWHEGFTYNIWMTGRG